MCEAALEEVSVLSSIYCGEGELQLLQQSGQDGIIVQINRSGGGGDGRDVSLLFHLRPGYPARPPDVSVSSTALSRTRCHRLRLKLQQRAAELPPEPMVHLLVDFFQECVAPPEGSREEAAAVAPGGESGSEWTSVLLLDHMRSRGRYLGLLERWSQQLQLCGTLFLGGTILLVLQGARRSIKEFCLRLRTVKVDVDSSGRKCKERMMKVLIEAPSSSSGRHGRQGFLVQTYDSVPELTAAFSDLHLADLYRIIFPSLKD